MTAKFIFLSSLAVFLVSARDGGRRGVVEMDGSVTDLDEEVDVEAGDEDEIVGEMLVLLLLLSIELKFELAVSFCAFGI